MQAIRVLTILLLFSGCATEKRLAKLCAKCPATTEVVTKETVKITPFDTALFISTLGKDIHLSYDSIAEARGYCCDMVNELNDLLAKSNGTITAKENGIKSSIFKSKGKVVFRCEADSLKKVIEGLRVTIEKLSSKKEVKVLPPPKCEKQHKDWLDKYDRPWFFISLGAFLLAIGWKFKPKLLGLFKKLPL